MASDGKVGPNRAFTVTRTIPASGVAPGALEAGARALASMDGMVAAQLLGQGHLRVRYDASSVGFWDIEQALDAAGIARPSGFWWRVKAEWFRYTDHNAQANATHVAACCSKPPGGHAGRPTR